MLTGRILEAEGARTLCVVDHVVDAHALLGSARMMATTLAKGPGYARVKAQLRAPALGRMRAVIESGDDPMLEEWI
jgi:enoyl-CoA hydratase/carnithine racemase